MTIRELIYEAANAPEDINLGATIHIQTNNYPAEIVDAYWAQGDLVAEIREVA